MRIQYKGMFDEVVVRDWLDENGYARVVKRGEAVECPDELAARLLEQAGNWAKAPAPPTRNTRADDDAA